ncbi:hypothetical protein CRUP_034945 [Coryphaenoides rupestris]|nr:hypothetical protein CRUP_034945 [Coryphaenoides rupestris]
MTASKLKEVLPAAGCSEPSSPRPGPRRPTTATPAAKRPPSSNARPGDAGAPLPSDRDAAGAAAAAAVRVAQGHADAHAPPLRVRDDNKERDSESRALLSRCRSAPNRKMPSGGTHAACPVRTRRERDTQPPQHRERNEAARTIQRAWRRFKVRKRPKEGRPLEWAESTDTSHTPNRKKTETRAHPAKLSASKNSVLQSIYGNSMARRGRCLRSAESQLLLDLSLRTQSQLSGIDCVHLCDTLSQATQYSYHLRPHSSAQTSRGRGKY